MASGVLHPMPPYPVVAALVDRTEASAFDELDALRAASKECAVGSSTPEWPSQTEVKMTQQEESQDCTHIRADRAKSNSVRAA